MPLIHHPYSLYNSRGEHVDDFQTSHLARQYAELNFDDADYCIVYHGLGGAKLWTPRNEAT